MCHTHAFRTEMRPGKEARPDPPCPNDTECHWKDKDVYRSHAHVYGNGKDTSFSRKRRTEGTHLAPGSPLAHFRKGVGVLSPQPHRMHMPGPASSVHCKPEALATGPADHTSCMSPILTHRQYRLLMASRVSSKKVYTNRDPCPGSNHE